MKQILMLVLCYACAGAALLYVNHNSFLEAINSNKTIVCEGLESKEWGYTKDSVFIYDEGGILEFNITSCKIKED